MADAEALMQKLLCGDTAPLTRSEGLRGGEQNCRRPAAERYATDPGVRAPGVVGQGTPAHVG